MFKNFIILCLFFLLASLLIQKPDNAKLLIQDLATSKNMVVDGTQFIKKTFDTEFSVVVEDETVLPSEHMLEGSKSNYTPIPNTHSPRVFNDGKIIEETWFDEK